MLKRESWIVKLANKSYFCVRKIWFNTAESTYTHQVTLISVILRVRLNGKSSLRKQLHVSTLSFVDLSLVLFWKYICLFSKHNYFLFLFSSLILPFSPDHAASFFSSRSITTIHSVSQRCDIIRTFVFPLSHLRFRSRFTHPSSWFPNLFLRHSLSVFDDMISRSYDSNYYSAKRTKRLN